MYVYNWRASVASETLTGVTQSGMFVYWRASVASETLTGVTQSKIGDVCLFIYLFIYMDVRMSSRFCVSYVVDPVPNCTKQNPLVYRSVPVSP